MAHIEFRGGTRLAIVAQTLQVYHIPGSWLEACRVFFQSWEIEDANAFQALVLEDRKYLCSIKGIPEDDKQLKFTRYEVGKDPITL